MSEGINPIRIVIADEHPLSRQGLRGSLTSEPDFHIVGVASDGPGVAQLVSEEKPDIVLIDFALALKCELKALCGSVEQLRPLRLVVTLKTIEKTYLVGAFRLGAHGVVRKGSASEELHKSIRSVMAGQYAVENESVGVLVEALRESLALGDVTKSPKDYGLTRREMDIITKIASGRSNKEVGEEFAISERTVKHHLTNIFGKVGVNSRLQLALFAVNQHIAEAPASSESLHAVAPDQDASGAC